MCVSLLILGIPIGGVMAFNYYIDPLWTFDHQNDFNDYQRGFDERVQKTNWINAQSAFNYDGLMIGTSRTTYINSDNFEKPLFNYGLSNLHISEYTKYLQYAKDKNEKPFEKVYVELTITSYDSINKSKYSSTEDIFSNAEDPFHKYVSLFSNETFQHAQLNYEMSKEDHSTLPRVYDRDLQVSTTFPSKDIDKRIITFKRLLASRDKSKPNWMEYEKNYVAYLQEIKDLFPESTIVPFTDLILADRLQIYINHPQVTAAYKRYITDIVEVFGAVYSFHQYNPVTTTRENFFDLYHFYPHIGDMVATSLQQGVSDDIMIVVTADNIDAYFESLGI